MNNNWDGDEVMKKLLAALSVTMIATSFSTADAYSFKSKDMAMPKLTDAKILNQLKAGNYKYYKVGLGTTKIAMTSNWGAEKYKKTVTFNNRKNFEYTYGKYNELIATTYGTMSSSHRPIALIKIKDATPKYDMNVVRNVLGTKKASTLSGGVKYYSYGAFTVYTKSINTKELVYQIQMKQLPAKAVAKPVITQPTKFTNTNTSAYYKNCKAVWASLGRPIYPSDPGYSLDLDKGGDGVGCESRPTY